MLCFFCDETVKTKTEIQREIESFGNIKYNIVHCFSEMTKEVFDTLMQDLVNRYKSTPITHVKQDLASELDNKVTLTSQMLSKATLAEYKLLDNPIADRIFRVMKEKTTQPSRVNELLTYFFNVASADCSFDIVKFNELSELILKEHDEPVKSLIRIRLTALKHYYEHNLDECINSLKEAITYIKNNQAISQWLLNDVAIDLRNVIIIRDNGNGEFTIANEGQEIINTIKENVVFPELDRIASNISQNAIKVYKKIELDSPYTTTILGYEEILKDLSSYFCIAILYGSITHIRLLPAKSAELLLPLCLDTNNIFFYAEYIKNIIISNELKDVDNSLRVANINTSLMPYINVDKLLIKIQNMPICHEQETARINILKHFCYYYNDDKFNAEESWFFQYILSRKTNIIFGNINKLILETIRKGIKRFMPDKVIEYCIYCIQSNNEVLMQNAVSITYVLDFSAASIASQEKFKKVLISNVKRAVLWSAIIQFGYKCTIDWDDLKDAVQQEVPNFYSSSFSLEFVCKEKPDLYKRILNYTVTINNRNATQGLSTVSEYADDPYGTISNIIKHEKLGLTFDELKPILSACEGTLLAEKQTPDAKIKAVTLILDLKKSYPDYEEWSSWGENIFQNKETVLKASYLDLFDKTSNCAVLFAYELLKHALEKSNSFIIQLFNLSVADDYDIIVCLKLLDSVFENTECNLSDEITIVILQLAIALSSHKETDIKFFSIKLLIWLTNSKYAKEALDRLSQCFDVGTFEIKAAILYRIKKIHGDSSIVDFIKQKAAIDPNYLVRSILCDI